MRFPPSTPSYKTVVVSVVRVRKDTGCKVGSGVATYAHHNAPHHCRACRGNTWRSIRGSPRIPVSTKLSSLGKWPTVSNSRLASLQSLEDETFAAQDVVAKVRRPLTNNLEYHTEPTSASIHACVHYNLSTPYFASGPAFINHCRIPTRFASVPRVRHQEGRTALSKRLATHGGHLSYRSASFCRGRIFADLIYCAVFWRVRRLIRYSGRALHSWARNTCVLCSQGSERRRDGREINVYGEASNGRGLFIVFGFGKRVDWDRLQ